MDDDPARNSAPQHDVARHPLTVVQACELFARLGVPRAKRSVQRFCEQGYLDCVRVKSARGDQFFVNQQSVERYAEELKQIDAVASIGTEPIDDVLERVAARNSAPQHDTSSEPIRDRLSDEPAPAQSATIRRLQDENLNLRIDNRGKEQAINFLTDQIGKKDQLLQDLSYRLGGAETRVAQLQAPTTPDNDTPRNIETVGTTTAIEAIVVLEPPPVESAEPPAPTPELRQEPKRSFLGRILG
jgi:hypothetical protein